MSCDAWCLLVRAAGPPAAEVFFCHLEGWSMPAELPRVERPDPVGAGTGTPRDLLHGREMITVPDHFATSRYAGQRVSRTSATGRRLAWPTAAVDPGAASPSRSTICGCPTRLRSLVSRARVFSTSRAWVIGEAASPRVVAVSSRRARA